MAINYNTVENGTDRPFDRLQLVTGSLVVIPDYVRGWRVNTGFLDASMFFLNANSTIVVVPISATPFYARPVAVSSVTSVAGVSLWAMG
jgi:hypothetical protein